MGQGEEEQDSPVNQAKDLRHHTDPRVQYASAFGQQLASRLSNQLQAIHFRLNESEI